MIEIHKNIFSRAQSIIFCRSSPKEKALIVKFVKNTMKFVVLAIGDGGNDVGMI
jgi:P-type E1-E2 ATPase